jgi:NAD(P)-dependent dehydrogenase (short-subunit alcohol dehydrogenase family)
VIDRESIASRLLGIVKDRTGYPAEVLRLDLDIEADLGIDSIKRVEILGKLRDAFPQLSAGFNSENMDRLARASTLGAIVERVEKMFPSLQNGADAPSKHAENGTLNGASTPKGLRRQQRQNTTNGAVKRFTLQLSDAPLSEERIGELSPDGIVLITEDEHGIAALVAQELGNRGIQSIRIGGKSRYVDWGSSAAVDAVIEDVRTSGPIIGLIHLSSLRDSSRETQGTENWKVRITNEARSLFLLARGLAEDLEAASLRGAACFIAATGMGGGFASAGPVPPDFFPGQGAIAGLVKTLAREWEKVRCRVVDFDLADTASRIAERIVSEALSDDDWTEVGYIQGNRIRLRTIPSPLRKQGGKLAISRGEPILITGGARGITALVAAELARRWQPTLLLIGTTPSPSDSLDPELDSLTTATEIKECLFSRLGRAGKAPSPAELEKAYQSLIRSREIRGNLEILRSTGAQVEYAQADVRDPVGMARVISDWRMRYGDPIGVIHGAGLIKDKLIRDKSPEIFDRVLGTKIDGALNLMTLLDPHRLRFATLFSSIAGRFGNRGQSDYSAANEVLNKLAIWLDRKWPCRIVSMIWGPWSGVGMVSDLESHLGSQGLGMIAPNVGVAALLDELTSGAKGDVEVIVSGDLGTLDKPVSRLSDRLEPAR